MALSTRPWRCLVAGAPARIRAGGRTRNIAQTYVATFVAPILGAFLAARLGYTPARFAAGGLRFAGPALFLLFGGGAAVVAPDRPVERAVR